MRFTESVRHWLSAQFLSMEMKTLDQESMALLARDNAMAVSDFCMLVHSKSGNSELLSRQIARAGLPEKVTNSKLSVMRDMQIVCSGCSMKRRCRRELSRQNAAPNYSAYCPNAPTIEALRRELS